MDQETIAEGRYLRLVRQDHWEYVERRGINGVVVIVPFLGDGRLIFIEQYRPAVKSICIEFPAGLSGDSADKAAEPLEAAARRELLEETGYEADEFDFLGESVPTAGLTSERMSFFAARGLRRVAAGGGVEHERIVTHLVPLAEVRTWLAEQSKRAVVSGTVYAGLYLTGQ
ncbi:MAG: NUDIX hydrolase [Pirellulales bacterium]